jgi:hypothetical protein
MSGMPSWNRPAMQLRVVSASDDVDDATDASDQWRILSREELTLCEYAEHALFPDKLQGNRDPATIQRVRDALNWWRRLIHDPPLRRISDRDINDFKQYLARQKGRKGDKLAQETIRQTLVRIRFVMREAAKTHVIDGRRMVFMETVPYFELPRKTKTDPRPYSFEELTKILDHCHMMTWPKIEGVEPPRFWRSLYEYFYYEGCRLEETLRLEYSDLKGEILTVRDEIAKHNHGEELWLQEESLAALERIRTPRRFIFELPRGWERDMDKIKREAKRILRAAGVYEPWRVFHGVRRTNASEVARVAGKQAAQKSMRHNDARTTEAYVSREAAREQAHQAKRLLPRLPSAADRRQLRLPFGD